MNRKNNLLNYFNRFANYLEKNSSIVSIKIDNDNIVFLNKNFDLIYKTWFLSYEKIPLETQIEWFFIRNYKKRYLTIFDFDIDVPEILRNSTSIEEFMIKMDVVGV